MSFSLGVSPTSLNASRAIEETCDVEFDETNGSQGEVFACDDVGDEPLREIMKNIVIG